MADLVPTEAHSGLEIVGVISFDGHDRRLHVGGLPILGSPEMLPRIVADLDRAGKSPVSLVVQESSERLDRQPRSDEETTELQSLMRISYDVFCFKKKTKTITSTI